MYGIDDHFYLGDYGDLKNGYTQPIFEDAARVAGGAIGTLSGVKRELDNLVRHQLDRLLAGMDFVTREEFDAVKEMAANARKENDRLEARIAAFEVAKVKAALGKKSVIRKNAGKEKCSEN